MTPTGMLSGPRGSQEMETLTITPLRLRSMRPATCTSAATYVRNLILTALLFGAALPITPPSNTILTEHNSGLLVTTGLALDLIMLRPLPLTQAETSMSLERAT